MLSSIFSNLKRETSSLDILEKLNTPLSVDDSNSKTTTPTSQNTSIILDNSSNGRLILSKMENLNKTPYNHFNIETSTPTSASNLSQNQSSSLLKSDFTQVIKPVSVRNSLKVLCETMKKQILIRAFYGWLVYHRHLKTVGTHLIGLVNSDDDLIISSIGNKHPSKSIILTSISISSLTTNYSLINIHNIREKCIYLENNNEYFISI